MSEDCDIKVLFLSTVEWSQDCGSNEKLKFSRLGNSKTFLSDAEVKSSWNQMVMKTLHIKFHRTSELIIRRKYVGANA